MTIKTKTKKRRIKLDHPLLDLVDYYFDSYKRLRKEHQDDNVDFNNEHSLSISGPEEWPFLAAAHYIVQKSNRTLIIYNSTKSYDMLHEVVGTKAEYMGWTEISVFDDERKISNYSTVIVYNIGEHSIMPEILSAVKEYCDGCFIRFG